MTTKTLEAWAKQAEVEMEEAQDGLAGSPAAEPKLFCDLYGVIQGAPDLTMEDFEAVKIRMDWDKFKDI